jgi:hypothetical protein
MSVPVFDAKRLSIFCFSLAHSHYILLPWALAGGTFAVSLLRCSSRFCSGNCNTSQQTVHCCVLAHGGNFLRHGYTQLSDNIRNVEGRLAPCLAAVNWLKVELKTDSCPVCSAACCGARPHQHHGSFSPHLVLLPV